mmetsp:Transcript_1658/g.3752  ORF Transcript_1658/g.3752 Transcript_1658/m.3752 type:complete len:162 (+) Transcript_1658:178-663(+)|eukprot:CAMPEP_0197597962 /NCGR_PEP_ID=MMETSP1326-20131121/28351_1 /TAXON_ID=1155430 /ORGANISM="Genus nov. species nov., Strain RCC2288" /LENGTH=161 /DNA_ID=CAMNT_0043164701 /DNA_START=110 /DNA_END=595 /DNA_ORIENTATION=-
MSSSIVIILWVVLFMLMGALLGMNMYMVICLSDLANDFINPHDSSSRINKLVVPEFVIHAVQTGLFVGVGSWSLLAVNTPLVLFHLRSYMRRECFMDVTEIFNQLEAEKRTRMFKIAFYAIVFIAIIYRLTECAVNTFLTTDGRMLAAQMLKEAATEFHHF